MFDKVIIGFGTNTSKHPWQPLEERLENVRRLYAQTPAVEVVTYSGLTYEAARLHGADVLLRGIRSTTDFEYERNLADINRNISGMESVFILALPELAAISSSLVRELAAFDAPYRQYLP